MGAKMTAAISTLKPQLVQTPQTFWKERLISYGLTASAVAICAPEGHAAIVYYDVADTTIPSNGSMFFDVVSGVVSTDSDHHHYFAGAGIKFGHYYTNGTYSGKPHKHGSAWVSGGFATGGTPSLTFNNGSAAVMPSNPSRALRMGYKDAITGSRLFNYPAVQGYHCTLGSSNFQLGQWQPGDTGYLGFQVNLSGTTCYGWAQVDMLANYQTRLLDFAYDNSGSSITAGAIPEPASSMALMALGAAGFALWKRRRQSKPETESAADL